MAEIADQQRCKRSDGRGWRCRKPVAEGRGYCEAHIQQAQLRQKRQPVPDHLKLKRKPKLEQESDDDGVTEAPVPRKRAKVVNLEMGIMEIPPADSSSDSPAVKSGAPAVKVGAPVITGFTRLIRTKNSEPIPISVVKNLPSIKENIKASAKEKINKKKIVEQKEITKTKKMKEKIVKKCHWCRLTSYCVLVKCLTCKKNFFCKECISKRLYCKKTVERECPVCQGECPCEACTRGKPKQVKTKEKTVSHREQMSDFKKRQQLHLMRELLPVMSKINLEKIIELDTEALNKGVCHKGLEVQIAGYTEKKECSFCKACIPDVHRSCYCCPYVLCLACCHDIRDGHLHSRIEDLRETKMIRSKRSINKPWRFYPDGRISCPPKNLGGCEKGLLHLTSIYPFCLTKDLEESAKQILCNFQLEEQNRLSDSSPCMLCNENGEAGLYFSTKQVFKDDHLEHFMNHWGKGKPIAIRDVFQSQSDLDWDFGSILCQYLEKSAASRNNAKIGSANYTRDWCEIEFRRKQILSRGITHENVWNESLKFKLRLSSEFLQDYFPDHHTAIIRSLPFQEYMNPFTGFMNLGTYLPPYQSKNTNLGSYMSILYGGSDNPKDADLLSNLRVHAYDEVNVLVYATSRPIRERDLNEVKRLMNKYNSQDHLKSSKNVSNRNKLEGMFASTSRMDDKRHSDINMDLTSSRLEDPINHEVDIVSDDSESDDKDLSLGTSCGAHWDIFRREDVPMLVEYLRKYSDKLSRSHGSPRKVVHPLFDEVFYLDDDHKKRLKEEFNVDALSVEQHIGEAVVIPAGCPYQMKKFKSSVNVVYKFMSPESALEAIKVSDEVRLLPVGHKAKGNMVKVKKMAISRMMTAIESMREVFVSQPEWSWPLVISHPAKSPS